MGIDGESSSTQKAQSLRIAFSESGGIIGRGVLIDWYSYSQTHTPLSPFTTGAIPLADIKSIIASEGITIRQGDILFIRSGFTAAYNALTPTEREAFPNRSPGGLLGFEATQESLEWLWESGFAAVAGDAPGFERGPATGSYNHPDVSIHQWALAGWGMPIGEMFDLEGLAEECERRKRWSFFLCSVPLKVCAPSCVRLSADGVDSWGGGESGERGGYFVRVCQIDLVDERYRPFTLKIMVPVNVDCPTS